MKIFGSSSIREIEAMSMLASVAGGGNEMRALDRINNENRLPDQTEATAVMAGAEFPEQPLQGSRMNAASAGSRAPCPMRRGSGEDQSHIAAPICSRFTSSWWC
jgi:hypothetical protein